MGLLSVIVFWVEPENGRTGECGCELGVFIYRVGKAISRAIVFNYGNNLFGHANDSRIRCGSLCVPNKFLIKVSSFPSGWSVTVGSVGWWVHHRNYILFCACGFGAPGISIPPLL